MDDTLENLQSWFMRHCDGDWEHQQGIIIETLDNPGWKVVINLNYTGLADKKFDSIEEERSDRNWLHCSVKGETFYGYGGVNNLLEILNVFFDWASRNNDSMGVD